MRSVLFVPTPLPEPATEHHGQFGPAPGVVAERVSYATDYGLRVPAIVYRPKTAPSARMPGIIVVNGHGGSKYSWYAWYAGILYAQAGAVVLTYDPIGEGERNSDRKDGTRQHDLPLAPPEMARRLSGLMITDLMQAVSHLAERPDVDHRRVAAVGYSMGSFIVGITGAIDTRLHSCVLAGGGNFDGPGGYWDSSKPMCQGIPYRSLMFLRDRGAVLYDLHAARGATLVINGSDDEVVNIPQMGHLFFEDLRNRAIAVHGTDRGMVDFQITDGGHRPYFLTRPVATWLEQQLHFANWTAHSIATMPETHIGDWAHENNVRIDEFYASESREAGTRALGATIPAVPHDDLNALPALQWEQEKGRFVYETWVKEARSRVTAE